MKANKSEAETHRRLNLRVTADVERRLVRLQQQTGAASLTETIRKALAALDEIVRVEAAGGRVLIREPDGEQYRLKVLQ